MDQDGLQTGIFCNTQYIRTIPCILKLVQMVCDLLALIICAAGVDVENGGGNKGFFIFVTIATLVITLIIFVINLLNVKSICLSHLWPTIEIIWCVVAALLLFIGSIVIAVIGKLNGVYGAAAFFGFVAFLLYVADAIYRFRMRGQESGMSRQEAYAANQQNTYNPPPPPINQMNARNPYPPADPPNAWKSPLPAEQPGSWISPPSTSPPNPYGGSSMTPASDFPRSGY